MCILYDLLTYCLYNIATVSWLVFFCAYSLSIEALVPEICAMFCWQVMKMRHFSLASRICWEYMHIAKVLLSENSCARNMCHILLAGYEDVPSFLNQWKLIERSYIIKICFISIKYNKNTGKNSLQCQCVHACNILYLPFSVSNIMNFIHHWLGILIHILTWKGIQIILF